MVGPRQFCSDDHARDHQREPGLDHRGLAFRLPNLGDKQPDELFGDWPSARNAPQHEHGQDHWHSGYAGPLRGDTERDKPQRHRGASP
jgi:hypothetical protein